jgi:LemA protein
MEIILIVIAIVIGSWVFLSFNALVTLKNRTKEAWSDIDVQLKRRYDLIPNLVETVKGYASHERELFEKVTQARSQAMGAKTIKDRVNAENALSSTLKSLFAVSENYPDLKASVNFLELQRELRDTEDKIQASRRFYNTNVRDLNTKIEIFPSNIIAGMFKFKQAEFFETEGESRNPVKVSF